eukprot:scaffold26363_cov113-Cylindrotheca_fusiformis.AAC.3
MKSAELLNEFVAPHYAWIEQNFAPLWSRLDFPGREEYSDAFQACSTDLVKASQSTGRFLFLTFRPIFQLLFIVLRSLFKVLLEKGWISLQKGAMQAKAGIIWFYIFQRSLTKKEVVGEIGIVSFCIAGYYLRKWLKRQTYWARAMRWVANKKKIMKKSYTNAVHRLAKVSIALAMTLPHLTFFGVTIGFKLLLPSVIRWLACDTYTTTALSVWYPFISTLAWIHHRHHSDDGCDCTSTSSTTNVRKLAKAYDKSSGKAKSTAIAKSGSKTRLDKKAPQAAQPKSEEATTNFWLRYWGTYATVQAFSRFCHMVPVFGRFVAKHPFFVSFASELKFFFFVWVFAMEALLRGTTEDAFLAKALPLRLTTRHLNPVVLDIVSIVSEAISKEKWKSVVHGKAQRVLDVFVMVRFISEKNRDWLLHVLEESRVVLIPSVTLFMPSFVTQFGVAYVQYLIPAAKSASSQKESDQLLYLQYWALHCMFFGVLTWLSALLWWIPFSTHVVFIAWCNLSFPKTIKYYYSVLEMELVAFGIVSGDAAVAVHETKTVQLLSAIAKRLPSATDDKGSPSDDASKKGAAPLENSKRKSRITSEKVSQQREVAADDDNQSETSVPKEVSEARKLSTSAEGDGAEQPLVSTNENDENGAHSNSNAIPLGEKSIQIREDLSLSSSSSSSNIIETEGAGKRVAKPMTERRSRRTRSQTTH